MTEPGPPIAARSRDDQDQLAKIFLKGRETPCPVCRYDRCNGVGAACPECGYLIRLQPIQPNPRDVPAKILVLIGTLIIINAIAIIPGQSVSTIRVLNRGFGIEAWMITNFIMILGFLIAGILAVISLSRVRSNTSNPIGLMLTAGLVLLSSILPATVMVFVEMF
ncbi:MAG: hypothetical protein AB8F26_05690 [Phycisphaerales bacterium]